MEVPLPMRWQRLRFWLFASSLIDLKMENPSLPASVSPFHSLHEQMAVSQSKKLLAALQSIMWRVKRQSGSHKTLEHADYPYYVFAFHDGEEIGPRMLSRIAKHTGLQQGDLSWLALARTRENVAVATVSAM